MRNVTDVLDQGTRVSAIGNIVELDKEEQEFERLVQLWADGEMSYETLLNNLPKHDTSLLKKFLALIMKRLT
jgi:hypothetical protein